MSATVVAVAQFAPSADPAANVAAIADLISRARGRGAEVVVFPEYASYFVDPFDETLRENAQTIDGPFVTELQNLARVHGVHVVAGLIERASDAQRVRNTVVAVSDAGRVAAYRKLHLYDAFGQRESDWVEPGETASPETFEVAGVRFALMTCYDLRFPEVSRILADADAHVILVPSQWARGALKEMQWSTLLRARAIENTIFVAAADHPPPLGVGLSTIVDPQGVDLAMVGTGVDIAVARIDTDAVERVRRINPALQLRRFTVVARSEGGAEAG